MVRCLSGPIYCVFTNYCRWLDFLIKGKIVHSCGISDAKTKLIIMIAIAMYSVTANAAQQLDEH